MASRRTLKVFSALVALSVLLTLPGLVWPAYRDSPLGVIGALPYIALYLLHGMGIPGLLQHGGACGWGWCAPTSFGWVFLVVLWLAVAWLLARGISAAMRATQGPRNPR